MANSSIKLKKLTLLELTFILEHLRSGYDHFKKNLNRKQLNELFALGELTSQQEEKLKANMPEKAGEALLLINTILTGSLGTWLGLLACVELGGKSFPVLFACAVTATILTSVIGFSIFKTIKDEARDFIIQQKLNNIQIIILDIINKKLLQKMQKMVAYLNWALNHINDHLDTSEHPFKESIPINYKLKSKESLAFWFAEFSIQVSKYSESLADNKIDKKVKSKIKKILNKINMTIQDEKCLTALFSLYAKSPPDHEITYHSLMAPHSLLTTLTKPQILSPKEAPKKTTLGLHKFFGIVIRFIPTILSIIGSVFVYTTFPKTISEQLNSKLLQEIFTSPTARAAEILIAALLTIYFCYSFIYAQKAKLEREKEMIVIHQYITNVETTQVLSEARVRYLGKLKNYVERIILVINIHALLLSKKSG